MSLAKMFQPPSDRLPDLVVCAGFFTTIPTCLPAGTVTIGTTGQRTGLGLTLSYDILKAYDGELTVQTSDGEGNELIIKP